MAKETGAYEIRQATEADIEDIAKLKFKGDEYHSQFNVWPSERDMGEARAGVKKHLNDDNSRIFIAVKEASQTIGFISINSRIRETRHPDYKNTGEINLVYVDSNYWRCGIGTGLVRRAMEFFESKDIEHITLRVVMENEPGVKFWNALSFETKILLKATTIKNVKEKL